MSTSAAGALFTNASNFKVDGGNFYASSGNINLNTTYVVSNPNEIEEIQKFTQWLTKINFRSIQGDTFAKFALGTGMWFIQGPKFEKWEASADKQTLWVTGMPGSGKTILTSIAVNHLELKRASTTDVAVLYVYCRYSDYYTTTDILCTFVRQLLEEHGNLVAPIKAFCMDHQQKGTRPSKSGLLVLLKKLLITFTKVYASIDALDELPDETKYDVLETLCSLPPNTSILLTSRPLNAIRYLIPHAEHVSMESGTGKDIDTFIMSKLGQSPRLRSLLKGNTRLIQEVCEQIKDKSQGMFLVVALHIDSLQRTTTLKSLRKALESLPSGVEANYRLSWERISSQSEEEASQARRAITWLTYADRSLTIAELTHALAVSEEDGEFDEEAVLDSDLLISICCGLLAVEEQSGLVRLVHYTARDFFRNMGAELHPNPNALIFTTCLAYLSTFNFPKSVENPDRLISKRQDLVAFLKCQPLIEYAYHNWGWHAQEALPEDGLAERIEGFLDTCDRYPWLIEDQDEVYNSFDLFQPVHVMAAFGLSTFLPRVLKQRHAKTLFTRRTALHLSALYGHDDFVRALLAQPDVNVNLGDNHEQTALMLASKEQPEVVRTLLGLNSVDIDKQDARGLTSFLRACQVGTREIVELHFARPEVVKVVVRAAGDGRTPLCEAVRCGQLETVKLLLAQKGVDVNLRDRGETPLIRACVKGFTGIIEVLLAHPDIKINKPDERGSTALHHAVSGKNELVVAILLGHKDLDPNVNNNHGNTPLTLAAYMGLTRTVQLMVGRPDVQVNKPEAKRKNTALHLAASRGHLECVSLLVGRDDINLDVRNARGRTPLESATVAGRDGIITFLTSGLGTIGLPQPGRHF